MMQISLIDAVIGAEVTGLDLVQNVDVRSIEKLNLALLERQLLCIRDQDLDPNHHVWQPSDLVIWDNHCTIHRASADFDISQRREFHRILLRGDVPK